MFERMKQLDRKFSEKELSRMSEREMRDLAWDKWGCIWGVDFEDEDMNNIKRALLENSTKPFYEDFYKAREEAAKKGRSIYL